MERELQTNKTFRKFSYLILAILEKMPDYEILTSMLVHYKKIFFIKLLGILSN